MFLKLTLIAGLLGLLWPSPAHSQTPSATVVYIGFNSQPHDLYPWYGNKVVVLTPTKSLDEPTMRAILAALDAAWGIYEEISGQEPSPGASTTLNGRDIIAVLPVPFCGAACSSLGSTGTEIGQPYFDWLYDGVKFNGQYDQIMFYEFGRNFWFYKPQLGIMDVFPSIAIVDRFIAMDRIGVAGGPFDYTVVPYPDFHRTVLFELLTGYLADPSLNWRNTLLTETAPPNPYGWSVFDLTASMYYRIYYDYGFDAYKAFFRSLSKQPTAVTPDDAIVNFLAAAKAATGQNYGFLFKGVYDAPPVVAPSTPRILSVNTSNGGSAIGQNTWITIKGQHLTPVDTPAGDVNWGSAVEFASGRMPTHLGSVSVTVNGKPAYVSFYCSEATSRRCANDQINVLTPLDDAVGPVALVVANGTSISDSFMVNMKAAVPSLLWFNPKGYVVATHANYSLMGPYSLYPYFSSPAHSGEALIFYGVGFGLPSSPIVDGSATQSGLLSGALSCQIGTTNLNIAFAGLVSPGLYQFNVVLPTRLQDGDHTLACNYGGSTSPSALLTTGSLTPTTAPRGGFPHAYKDALAVAFPVLIRGSLVTTQSDFFQIDLSQETMVEFNLDGSGGFSAWLALWNADGSFRTQFGAPSSSVSTIVDLPAGSWTFSVSNSAPGPYQLSVHQAVN